MAAKGRAELFDCLKGCLTVDRESLPYATAAQQLGMTEGAVEVAAHRLRQRYGKILREEIGHTVAALELIDGELQELFAALGAQR